MGVCCGGTNDINPRLDMYQPSLRLERGTFEKLKVTILIASPLQELGDNKAHVQLFQFQNSDKNEASFTNVLEKNSVSIVVDFAPAAIQHFRIKIFRGKPPQQNTSPECYGQFDFTLGELIAKRGENIQGKLIYGNIFKESKQPDGASSNTELETVKTSVHVNVTPADGYKVHEHHSWAQDESAFQIVQPKVQKAMRSLGLNFQYLPQGQKMENKSGNDDAVYFVFNKLIKGNKNDYVAVHKTEYRRFDEDSVSFPNVIIDDLNILFGNDKDNSECYIQVMHNSNYGTHIELASAYVKQGNLTQNSSNQMQPSGQFSIVGSNVFPYESFLQFLYGGLQVKTHVAIDFSSDLYNQNSTQKQVSSILAHILNQMKDYDPNETFPLYGFGGKIIDDPEPELNQTSGCFALNGKFFSPECKGVNNVIGAYQNSLEKTTSGDIVTYKSILDQVNGYVDKHKEIPFFENDGHQEFSLLVILAGGIVTNENIDKITEQAIVEASQKPISIIVIGESVNFHGINQNHLEDIPFQSEKTLEYTFCKNSIAFLPISLFKSNPADFTRQFVSLFQSQVTQYYQTKFIAPGKPEGADERAARSNQALRNPFYTMKKEEMVRQCKAIDGLAGGGNESGFESGLDSAFENDSECGFDMGGDGEEDNVMSNVFFTSDVKKVFDKYGVAEFNSKWVKRFALGGQVKKRLMNPLIYSQLKRTDNTFYKKEDYYQMQRYDQNV